MDLGTFAVDNKGNDILPSKRPEMPGLEFEEVQYRFHSLEQAHNIIGNSAISSLPNLPKISEVKGEVSEEVKKPIILFNNNKGK